MPSTSQRTRAPESRTRPAARTDTGSDSDDIIILEPAPSRSQRPCSGRAHTGAATTSKSRAGPSAARAPADASPAHARLPYGVPRPPTKRPRSSRGTSLALPGGAITTGERPRSVEPGADLPSGTTRLRRPRARPQTPPIEPVPSLPPRRRRTEEVVYEGDRKNDVAKQARQLSRASSSSRESLGRPLTPTQPRATTSAGPSDPSGDFLDSQENAIRTGAGGGPPARKRPRRTTTPTGSPPPPSQASPAASLSTGSDRRLAPSSRPVAGPDRSTTPDVDLFATRLTTPRRVLLASSPPPTPLWPPARRACTMQAPAFKRGRGDEGEDDSGRVSRRRPTKRTCPSETQARPVPRPRPRSRHEPSPELLGSSAELMADHRPPVSAALLRATDFGALDPASAYGLQSSLLFQIEHVRLGPLTYEQGGRRQVGVPPPVPGAARGQARKNGAGKEDLRADPSWARTADGREWEEDFLRRLGACLLRPNAPPPDLDLDLGLGRGAAKADAVDAALRPQVWVSDLPRLRLVRLGRAGGMECYLLGREVPCREVVLMGWILSREEKEHEQIYTSEFAQAFLSFFFHRCFRAGGAHVVLAAVDDGTGIVSVSCPRPPPSAAGGPSTSLGFSSERKPFLSTTVAPPRDLQRYAAQLHAVQKFGALEARAERTESDRAVLPVGRVVRVVGRVEEPVYTWQTERTVVASRVGACRPSFLLRRSASEPDPRPPCAQNSSTTWIASRSSCFVSRTLTRRSMRARSIFVRESRRLSGGSGTGRRGSGRKGAVSRQALPAARSSL